MSEEASTGEPHDLEEIVLNVDVTPPCPNCSRPTILLARYPHSWPNNKGATVSGFRESVLCRVCDRDDSAVAPLIALCEEDGSFPADKLDVFGPLAEVWVEDRRNTAVDEGLLNEQERLWRSGEL
ncbi:DUF6300 family protein [Streptomyces sp. NPDC051639]|uniref:DUF6300 family protein n=1 Tax=unclassified Streptomyces TaxID=2593676 RepID=UPI00143E8D0B|nr:MULTISPECIES: DUF6300 family protein [unclassified Streptomyces]QIY66582.1 hypothetical protein HEP85_40260 [Streptomyces sp. RPA4-2]